MVPDPVPVPVILQPLVPVPVPWAINRFQAVPVPVPVPALNTHQIELQIDHYKGQRLCARIT